MNSNIDTNRLKTFELIKEFVHGQKYKEKVKKFFKNDLMPHICAFLNVADNKRSCIHINIEDGVKPKEVDIFKNKIENHIRKAFGIPLLYESLKVVDVDKGFQLIVTSRPELSSLKYNLYLPSNTSIEILSTLSIDIILPIINGWNKSDNQPIERQNSESFTFDDIFPLQESNTIQLKCCKQENELSWSLLCKEIQSSRLSHYVSAFANDKGGRIYYGIEDEERKVKGQTLREEHQEKVRKKINDILIGKVHNEEEEKMKWGTEDDLTKWSENTPDKPWNIQFIPVYENGIPMQDKFVIVVTVDHFPNGVFSKSPQSYQWDEVNEKPVLIEYTKWREKMRNSYGWKENEIDRDVRMNSLETINMVDELVDSGKSIKEVIKNLSKDTSPITLLLQHAFVHYRYGDWSNVEKYLAEAREILNADKPPVNRLVHELHYCSLKASYERSRGHLQESLLTTYGCLEKTKRVIPGWETAIIWNTHGKNLAATACRETSGYERNERFYGAVRAWCQAIYHARRAMTYGPIAMGQTDPIAKIIHMSQLYIALLYLGFTPSGEVVEVPPQFTEEEVRIEVQNRIKAVSIGRPLSKYNKCLCLMVNILVEPNDESGNQIREDANQIPRIKRLAIKVLERLNPANIPVQDYNKEIVQAFYVPRFKIINSVSYRF